MAFGDLSLEWAGTGRIALRQCGQHASSPPHPIAAFRLDGAHTGLTPGLFASWVQLSRAAVCIRDASALRLTDIGRLLHAEDVPRSLTTERVQGTDTRFALRLLTAQRGSLLATGIAFQTVGSARILGLRHAGIVPGDRTAGLVEGAHAGLTARTHASWLGMRLATGRLHSARATVLTKSAREPRADHIEGGLTAEGIQRTDTLLAGCLRTSGAWIWTAAIALLLALTGVHTFRRRQGHAFRIPGARATFEVQLADAALAVRGLAAGTPVVVATIARTSPAILRAEHAALIKTTDAVTADAALWTGTRAFVIDERHAFLIPDGLTTRAIVSADTPLAGGIETSRIGMKGTAEPHAPATIERTVDAGLAVFTGAVPTKDALRAGSSALLEALLHTDFIPLDSAAIGVHVAHTVLTRGIGAPGIRGLFAAAAALSVIRTRTRLRAETLRRIHAFRAPPLRTTFRVSGTDTCGATLLRAPGHDRGRATLPRRIRAFEITLGFRSGNTEEIPGHSAAKGIVMTGADLNEPVVRAPRRRMRLATMIRRTARDSTEAIVSNAGGPLRAWIPVLTLSSGRNRDARRGERITERLRTGIGGVFTGSILHTGTRLPNALPRSADLTSIAVQTVLTGSPLQREMKAACLGITAIQRARVPVFHGTGRLNLPSTSDLRIAIIGGAGVPVITHAESSPLTRPRDTGRGE